MKKEEVSDYDSGWKEAISFYFKDFMLFFFPNIHNDIDFEKGFVFLDKEFEKIVKESKEKKRYVDKLAKVFLTNGKEEWLLIHIEIQGGHEKKFAERMYVYNYRIYDTYKKEVITVAVLADESKQYMPNFFETKRWGFVHTFKFPVVKLIDFKDKVDIEKAQNPFEIITFAHLKNLEVKKDNKKKLFWKISLVRLLYEKGYKKEDILNLYRFIDWIMVLPIELSIKFHEDIIKYEEEKKMPFITTAERIGVEKGIKEAISDLLEIRFTSEGTLLKKINKIKDIDRLRTIKDAVKKANSIDEIYKFL